MSDFFEETLIATDYLAYPTTVMTTTGYLYLLKDSKYPDAIKIGFSRDLEKRLRAYNADRPMKTCRYVFISKAFVDVLTVEKKILNYVYDNQKSPTTFTKEWFLVEEEAYLLHLIKTAEKEFTLVT